MILALRGRSGIWGSLVVILERSAVVSVVSLVSVVSVITVVMVIVQLTSVVVYPFALNLVRTMVVEVLVLISELLVS